MHSINFFAPHILCVAHDSLISWSSRRLTHSLMFLLPIVNGNLPFLSSGMRKRATATKPVQFRTFYDPLPSLGVPSILTPSRSVGQVSQSISLSTFKAKDIIDVLSRLQTLLARLDFIPHTFRLILGNLTPAPLDKVIQREMDKRQQLSNSQAGPGINLSQPKANLI